MYHRRHAHILNAATSLLGVCFVVIGGLKFSNVNDRSYSDELAWIAAFLLFSSIIVSYLGLRNGDARDWQTIAADWAFFAGLIALMAAVASAALVL